MTDRTPYAPGPARGARIHQEGEHWTLVLTRDLRHPPALVWQTLTDPAHLRHWAPFDADGDLGRVGARVKLTTVGAPTPMVSEATVTRAEAPRALNRQFIAMGAAGWHVCLDVMDHLLGGTPLGRIVGADALQFEGWQRLNAEYAQQFGVKAPSW